MNALFVIHEEKCSDITNLSLVDQKGEILRKRKHFRIQQNCLNATNHL
jgi:hypothetical protein